MGGGGSPKNRQKEHNQLICDSDKGGGVKNSENFVDVIYGSPLSKFIRRMRLQKIFDSRQRDLLAARFFEGAAEF